MNPGDRSFLFRELQVIRQIIQDETWLEGERRGCYVPPHDRVVRANVCAVVLRIGAELREKVSRAMTGETRMRTIEAHDRAA